MECHAFSMATINTFDGEGIDHGGMDQSRPAAASGLNDDRARPAPRWLALIPAA